jgi:hypothetical protein
LAEHLRKSSLHTVSKPSASLGLERGFTAFGSQESSAELAFFQRGVEDGFTAMIELSDPLKSVCCHVFVERPGVFFPDRFRKPCFDRSPQRRLDKDTQMGAGGLFFRHDR